MCKNEFRAFKRNRFGEPFKRESCHCPVQVLDNGNSSLPEMPRKGRSLHHSYFKQVYEPPPVKQNIRSLKIEIVMLRPKSYN